MFITVFFGMLFLICALVSLYFGTQDKHKDIAAPLILIFFVSLVLCAGTLSSLQTYGGGRPMDYKDIDMGRYKLFSTYQGPSDNGYITVLNQKDGEKAVRSVVFKKKDWRVEKNDGYITVEERTINNGTKKKEKIAY